MDKAKHFHELRQIVNCRIHAENNTNRCYHPACIKDAINSHILQRNGMLSVIAEDSHLWEIEVDNYRSEFYHFKRNGLKQVMTFNGFCEEHDTAIFKDIENDEIDFTSYRTHILFTYRTLCNELFRKEVNMSFYTCLVNKLQDKYNNERFHLHCKGERLGIQDMKVIEKRLWEDIDKGTESYKFRIKYLPKVNLVISSSFNYVTSNESSSYFMRTGKHPDSLGELYINLVPYGENTILLMGYNKSEEKMVKDWFDKFFDCADEQTFTRITNLILFQCETWSCNDTFHQQQIKGIEDAFYTAIKFSMKNGDERKFFKLNIFEDGFKEKFSEWSIDIKKAYPHYFIEPK